MASSGVLSGSLSQLRLPRGTVRIPISAGMFLTNVVIVGDTFQIGTLGEFILDTVLKPSAASVDTNYTVELFDETAGVILQSFDCKVAPVSAPDDQSWLFTINVVDVTHFYSLRITTTQGNPDFTMSLSGPTFTMVISSLTGSSGGVTTATAPLFVAAGNMTLGAPGVNAVAPTTADANASVIWSPFDAAHKGLVIQGQAAQAANLQEWQDSTGAILAHIDPAGNVGLVGKLTVGGGIDPTFLELNGLANNTYFNMVNGNAVAVSPANQGRIRYNVTTQQFEMSLNGAAYVPIGAGGSGVMTSTAPLFITGTNMTLGAGGSNAVAPTTPDANSSVTWSPFDAAHKGLVIQGQAAQAAHLQEWQDSTGAVLAFIDPAGNMTIGGKLTVTGAIDPTSLSLTGANNSIFVDWADGQNVPVSGANHGRIIYNAATQTFQASQNGGAFTPVQIGTPTLAQVLAAGNTTGANNILVTVGQQIDTAAAGVLNLGNTNATATGIGNPAGGLSTFQMFVNQGGAALHGSNAGFQFSSTTANRGSSRFNQYGNNAGVPGITGFKSRGANVGSLASVADGDVLFRATAVGVAGDNASIPLAGFLSIQVPTGGTNPTWVATDFSVSLVPLAGPINSNRQVFKVTSEAALDFINGTTAPVTIANHGGIRYNNATPAFEVSLNTGAWTPLLTGASFTATAPLFFTGTNMTLGASGSNAVAPTTPDAASSVTWSPFNAAHKGLVLQGQPAQAANLQEWQDSTGTAVAFMDPAGNMTISGKLTVGGAIDPTSLSLAGTTANTFLNMTDGSTVPVSPAAQGRIRYNNVTGQFEQSINGGAYTILGDVVVSQIRYVAMSGSDVTGNGTISAPYATVTQAMSSITDAAPTKRYMIYVFPGNYVVNGLTIKSNVFIYGLDYFTTRITNNTNWVIDADFGVNQDNRSGVVGINIRNPLIIDFNSVTSNQGKFYVYESQITFGATFTAFSNINQFVIGNCEVFGDIVQNGINSEIESSYIHANVVVNSAVGIATTQLIMTGSAVDGNATVTATGADVASLRLQVSPIAGVTTANGANATLAFTNDSVTGTPVITGGAVMTFLSSAQNEGYTPAVPGNWAPAPTQVAAALDQLAARISSGGGTLQQAYNEGQTINEAAVAGSITQTPITITNTVGTATDVLQLTKNPGAAFAGNALTVSMGANATGTGIKVSMNAASTGIPFEVDPASGGFIRMGTPDAFARDQIWHTGLNSVLRLGADVSDGDPMSVDSQGIVVYEPSLTFASRIKSNRFGLTRSADTSLYYFRVDDTQAFYTSDPTVGPVYGANTVHWYVNRTSGLVAINNATAGFPVQVGTELLRVQGGILNDFTSTTALQVTQAGGGTPALVVDTTNTRVGIGTAPGAFTLDVNGNTRITGKLTVTGAIDPTSLSLAGAANNTFLNMTNGNTVALSAANQGTIVYNSTTQTFQASLNGGAYTNFQIGTPTLTQVLAAGNTTGANNILVTVGQQIDTAAAGVLNLGNTNATAAGIGNPAGGLSTFQVFINQGGAALHGSNAGLQFSSTTANRAGSRYNQYGANTGVPGITGFKSRGATVGSLASVADGDTLFRATAIGVAADNATIPLAGFISIQVPTGGTQATWVATDFALQLVPLAGPTNSRREVFKITSEAAADFINGTTAPVTVANHGGIRYNNATPAFEVSLNGGAWTPLITAATGLAFSSITTGVNTTATMTVGTGASMLVAPGSVFGLSTIGVTNVVVGNATTGVNLSTGARNTLVGSSAGSTLQSGSDNVLLGQAASTTLVTTSSAIAIGSGSLAASNQFVAGSSGSPTNDVYFGKGASAAAPTNYTIHGTASTTNGTNGADITIAGGLANQAADAGGNIVFQTAAPAAGLTLVNRLFIDNDGGVKWVGIPTASAPATSGANNGTIYYDSTLQMFMASQNNAAYVPLIGGGGSVAFSAITTGVNTTATMTVGAGALMVVAPGAEFGVATVGTDNIIVGTGATGANLAGGSANNILIGAAAGRFTTTGTANVYIGTAAGGTATTATGNTAVGFHAGENMDANNNTLIGSSAGAALTTGVQNTFIGSGAGSANTASTDAILIGFNAASTFPGTSASSVITIGDSSFAASASITIGHGSGAATSTGSNVVILGQGAGTSLTSAANNVFIGFQTGAATTTGGQNVFIGASAGLSNTTAIGNTFVGYHAGQLNTTGVNTFIGHNAGVANTTGDQNVFIGQQAGAANVAGSRNTYIGYQAALVAAGAGDSDNVCIGWQAGNNMNGTGVGQNTFVGTFAGEATTTGNTNTFIGYGAAALVAGTSASVAVGNFCNILNAANNCVVIGKGATVGDSQISIGYQVGFLDPSNTGTGNIFIGTGIAFNTNTTATANTLIGNSAAVGLTTGSGNSCVGFNSLNALVDGVRNSAIGESAGGFIVSGNDNTFLGYSAGSSQINDNNNTYVGSAAGQAATGSFNTLLGSTTAQNMTASNNNVVVGYNSGVSIVTGSSNILVGSTTDVSNNTDSNAIVMGFQSKAAAGCITIGQNTGALGMTGANVILIGGAMGTAITTAANDIFIGSGTATALTTGSQNIFIGTGGTGQAVDTSTGNIGIGYQVMLALNGASSNNVGVGNFSLSSITSGVVRNTAIGDSSGASVVTGGDNVFVGGDCDAVSGTVTQSVAVGSQSWAIDNCVSIGFSSGSDLATGVNLTLVGNSTGLALTSATDCTFIGYFAGTNTTTGSSNTFVGSQCGQANIDGTDNTCMGRLAGFAMAGTNDVGNVLIGSSAGTSINGGNGSNTAVGTTSAAALTTGSNNVALGSGTGGTLTTGNFNILLGTDADVFSAATTQAIAIGPLCKAESKGVVIASYGVSSGVVNDLIIESGDAGFRRTDPAVMSITDGQTGTGAGALQLTGIPTVSAPPVAPANSGRIYYDSTLQQFMFSKNGGAYVALTLP
jgi:hypothetical protein